MKSDMLTGFNKEDVNDATDELELVELDELKSAAVELLLETEAAVELDDVEDELIFVLEHDL
jgi:hypothetical protein